jgi:hypothetical protein
MKARAWVNNPEAWKATEEFLQGQMQWMLQALATEQSEPALRQWQGKLALLNQLLQMRKSVNEVLKNVT